MVQKIFDFERCKHNLRRYLSFCLSPLLLFLACSDDLSLLNSLDTKFTNIDVVIVADTLDAVSSSTFRNYLPMNGRFNLVGKTGGYEAFLAVQFSSLPQRDTVNVISAQLKLRAATWFGDSSSSLSFTVHKILRGWSSLSLTWDSLAGFYEESVVRGTYTGTVSADTEYVVVDLDTSMVREWLQPSTITQYGILLNPGTTGRVVRGFTAFGTDSAQFNPTLTVIAQNLAGTVVDTNEYSIGSDTFVGNIDNLASNAERIYAQSGVVYRSKLTFDASSIPTGAIVTKAELVLTLDEAASIINKFSADTLVAVHVLASSTDSTLFELAGSLPKPDVGSAIAVDLRHAAQLWANGINNGILLRASSLNEFSSLDLHVFYGPSAADPAVRPRVEIFYSIEKEVRK